MTYLAQIVDIFVSSPGDVAEYRNKIISIVQSWNQRNGRSRQIFFNCLRWEDLVSPDIGETGQDVINAQIGDEYDIFLGVMWARFGSQTTKANSGTEEEFDRAIARHTAGESLRVSFLFCTADVPHAKLDGEQITLVQKFKKKVQEKGCLTRDFMDEASLINALNLILDKFSNVCKLPSELNGRDLSYTTEDPIQKTIDEKHGESNSIEKIDGDEPGFFDAIDEYEESTEKFAILVGAWGAKLGDISSDIVLSTSKMEELSKFGHPDLRKVRDVLNHLTTKMDEFGIWCEDTINELEREMANVSRNMILIVDLSQDLNENIEDVTSARDSFLQLIDSTKEASSGISAFTDSLESTPRLDKKLNKAIRKVINTHGRLVQKNELFQEDVHLCADELSRRIDSADLR